MAIVDLRSSIVLVLGPDGTPKGTGFVLSDQYIVTCAHVIESAGVGPGDQVTIQYVANQVAAKAIIVPAGWRSPKAEDIAILQPKLPLPDAVRSLSLDATSQAASRSFVTYGVPAIPGAAGLWAQGRIDGVTTLDGLPVLQLESENVSVGYSGAPVFEEDSDRVFGMISAIWQPETGGRQENVAFAIPSETINDVLSQIETSSIPQEASDNDEFSVLELIRQRNLPAHTIKKNAATDQPIDTILDDRLGFRVYVLALRDFIGSKDTTTPLTIGVDGPWGTGKTSLMRMLNGLFDPPKNLLLRFLHDVSIAEWYIGFLFTLPLWPIGKLLVFLSNRRPFSKLNWLKNVRKGMQTNPYQLGGANPREWSPTQWLFAETAQFHTQGFPTVYPTVWFNAWKFDQEEQLWAALALAVIDQIKQRYGPTKRILFWLALTFKRTNLLLTLWSIIKKFAVPIILAILAWQFSLYIDTATPKTSLVLPEFDFIFKGSPLLWAGAVITFVVQTSKIVKDPFQVSVDKAFNSQDYQDKVGFIGKFEEDFQRIVSLVTRPTLRFKRKKLLIFIDDLDRCEPPKAADIIEAINLFLDSEGCVFVLGMDSPAVVASIETKYKDLVERLTHSQTSGVTPGRLFLDKIIQVPFHVPQSTETSIEALVNAIISDEEATQPGRSAETAQPQGIAEASDQAPVEQPTPPTSVSPDAESFTRQRPDVASYQRDDVVAAIHYGSTLLEANPRQVKRFINVFRLSIYIADQRNIFEEHVHAEDQVGINLRRLAAWTAWSIRWPRVARYLYLPTQLSTLRKFLATIAEYLNENGHWKEQKHQGAHIMQIKDWREDAENDTSHWCNLLWEQFLIEPDFCAGIHRLACFWDPPEPNEVDWLQTILSMSRVTFTVEPEQPPPPAVPSDKAQSEPS